MTAIGDCSKGSAVVNRAQLPAHGYPIALLDPESRPRLARPVISNRQSHSFGSVLISALSDHPLVFRLPGSTCRRVNASMMGGLKSPTMNRQDRQTRNAIKRNPSPNETRPHTLGIGPKPQNARIAKSKATAAHNILEKISHLPLMLRHDRRAHRFADGNGLGKRRGAIVHCSRQLL